MILASIKKNATAATAFLAIALAASQALAAINANVVWELRQAGSANNGGGFLSNPFQSPPSAPVVTPSGTGGTVAAATYYCVCTYTPGVGGETPISGQTSVTTSGATASFTVTAPSNPGTGGTWNLYVATATGGPYFPQGTALAFGSNRVVTATPPTSGTQPAGTDRTLSTSAFVAVDNAAITATTTGANSNVMTFTAGYTPAGADVGNFFKPTAGTNINVGWYQITGVTSTTWTVTGSSNLTTAGGAGSAITGNMGGAIDGPATIANIVPSGNTIFMKYSATPYAFTSAGNNVATGTVTFSQDGLTLVGYDTTRTYSNTDANRPILRPSNNSLTLFNCNNHIKFLNLDFDNPTPRTSTIGVQIGGTGLVKNCRFNTYQQWALQMAAGSKCVDCEFIGCGSGNMTVYFNAASTAVRCIAKACDTSGASNAVYGAHLSSGNVLIDCVSINSTGGHASFLGGDYLQGCVAYGSGTGSGAAGFDSGSFTTQYERCISYGNAGWGFSSSSGADRNVILTRCYTGNNTVGAINPAAFGPDQQISCGTLSGDPFTNAAGYDFSLNSTAGAGASVRGLTLVFPGPNGTTTSNPDAGAAQHAAAAAGGFVPGPIRLNSIAPRRDYRIIRKAG